MNYETSNNNIVSLYLDEEILNLFKLYDSSIGLIIGCVNQINLLRNTTGLV